MKRTPKKATQQQVFLFLIRTVRKYRTGMRCRKSGARAPQRVDA